MIVIPMAGLSSRFSKLVITFLNPNFHFDGFLIWRPDMLSNICREIEFILKPAMSFA